MSNQQKPKSGMELLIEELQWLQDFDETTIERREELGSEGELSAAIPGLRLALNFLRAILIDKLESVPAGSTSDLSNSVKALKNIIAELLGITLHASNFQLQKKT